jgi:hypothetical protein
MVCSNALFIVYLFVLFAGTSRSNHRSLRIGIARRSRNAEIIKASGGTGGTGSRLGNAGAAAK